MATRKCANWIKSYMEFSAHSEAPDKFHFWTAVSVIAGALRRKVWIDMGYFQWTPNFFIVFVAPPGVANKSTTASIGMNLLRQVDGVKFGPDASTWQAFVTALGEAGELYPLPDGDYFPMSCLTVTVSEFGTFLNPSDREMVDTLVALWDGQIGSFTKTTKTSGSDSIENPWVNMIGCTTPAWISGNFPEYMIGGGFTSRCVFVYADQKRKLVAYPKQHFHSNWRKAEANLVHDLQQMAEIQGAYKLSEEAQAWGIQWYEAHHNGAKPAHLNNDRFAGYLARKQTHIHKLAIVMAAATRNETVLEVQDLEIAEKFVTGLETDMPKIFGHIGQSTDTFNANRIVQHIWAYQKIERTKLYRLVFLQMSKVEFEAAVNAAIAAGYVKQVQHGTELFLLCGANNPGDQVHLEEKP